MRDFSPVMTLPRAPGVYALQSGASNREYVVYVGIAGSLRDRVRQHLILNDSSITTGQAASTLNTEHVSSLCWWEHSAFHTRPYLEAAESIAFDVLNPTLRSRGRHSGEAQKLLQDPEIQNGFKKLFEGSPAGRLDFLNLTDAIQRIDELEKRIRRLEGERE